MTNIQEQIQERIRNLERRVLDSRRELRQVRKTLSAQKRVARASKQNSLIDKIRNCRVMVSYSSRGNETGAVYSPEEDTFYLGMNSEYRIDNNWKKEDGWDQEKIIPVKDKNTVKKAIPLRYLEDLAKRAEQAKQDYVAFVSGKHVRMSKELAKMLIADRKAKKDYRTSSSFVLKYSSHSSGRDRCLFPTLDSLYRMHTGRFNRFPTYGGWVGEGHIMYDKKLDVFVQYLDGCGDARLFGERKNLKQFVKELKEENVEAFGPGF